MIRLVQANVLLPLAVLAAGCVQGPQLGEPSPSFHRLDIEFDPPLREPGRLSIKHESGFESVVTTGRTGLALNVPPGPLALRLEADGGLWERLFTMGHSPATLRWQR